ncbi:MAG: DUF1559 domain-containing protein, partial [Pirellulales bacterium]|nr:DUF1559 domain-containing protein [Pirellulales bacterium]
IIGILIALLLPAVQAAREAARRIQCTNHFKQIGLALHNYHETYCAFPTGSHWWRDGNCDHPGPNFYGWAWNVLILPYTEQRALHDLVDFSGMYHQPGNREVGAQVIAIYSCPSDPHGGGWVDAVTGLQQGTVPGEDFRASSAVGVADSIDWTCNGHEPAGNRNGMLFQESSTRMGDVKDGTSHTLFVGEITGAMGIHRTEGPAYMQHMWIAHCIQDTADGINGPGSVPGGRDEAADPIDGDGWSRHDEMRDEIGFSSFHPGGCHFLMVDGSVHFFGEEINQAILAALTTRESGEVFHYKF